MSDREFLSELSDMSPSAIDRFRRLRKLSPQHNQALDTFLRQHPDKRLTAGTSQIGNTKAVKAKSKSVGKPKAKPAPKKLKADDDGYVQLWMRMRAWWDGVELDTQSPQKTNRPQPRLEINTNKGSVPKEDDSNYRLEIIQQLWGQGNSLPGGENFTAKLIAPVKLSRDMVVADLTAGLGGPLRHIVRSAGVIAHGFDVDKEFVETGNQISSTLNMSDNASILPIDFVRPEDVLDKSRYDVIVVRELFYAIADRKAFLSTLYDALKPDGALIFTDFCLADRSAENKSVLNWRQNDPKKPFPAAADEYRELLKSLRFDVKSIDDISDIYVAAIQSGWKSIIESLKSGNFSRGYVDTLMQEGQVWLSRSKAIESGQLRVIKGRAIMNKGPKRSLTDSMSID